jgi:ComF family protein
MTDTRVALRYQFPADWLITELKFSARLWHGPLLAALIAEALEARPIPDLTDAVLVPVPLHRRRQRVRGYNQAVEIARPLARRLGCRLDTALLDRGRATREQSSLSARERRRNVAGAFRLRRPPDFTHGIVVDDVVTTGATSREVARLLRHAGCRRVSVLAAARA